MNAVTTEFLRSGLLLCLGSAALWAAAGRALASGSGERPVLEPGESFRFPAAPKAVSGSCDSFALAFCNWVADETPLRAYSYGVNSLARSSTTVRQHHEFTLSDSAVIGSRQGSVVAAALVGSVEIGGFLFTMGGATACAEIELKLLDVTETPEDPVLAWSGSVASYRLESSFSASLAAGADVSVEGGFPYVGAGAGGSIGVEVGTSFEVRVLRNERVDFAFDCLLRRGRTYRLQLELSTATHNRVLGGISIASFYSAAMGGPVVPNAFNPEKGSQPGTETTWLSMFTESSGGKPALFRGRVSNYGLPKADADLTAGSVLGLTRNLWEQGLTNPWNQLSNSEQNVVQSSAKAVSRVFGTPMGAPLGVDQLVRSDFMRLANDDESEAVDLPGVQVLSLSLTIQDDLVELDRRAANRQLEQLLMSTLTPASVLLPSALGGELEDVLELVDRRIEQFAAAGLATGSAPFLQALARSELAQGNYRQAYARARGAYQLLVK